MAEALFYGTEAQRTTRVRNPLGVARKKPKELSFDESAKDLSKKKEKKAVIRKETIEERRGTDSYQLLRFGSLRLCVGGFEFFF